MSIFETVAREFQMKPEELFKESLKIYLLQKLYKVESEIFLLLKKYGIKDVFELDNNVKDGLINEAEAYDDYFTLDNLEADREKIRKFLEAL